MIRLDDLYRMVANIYGEQNFQRPPAATFAHFVEVCGMLTIHDRKKKREGVSVDDALCKALGWYFPLMAKFGVRSVEALVFRKYPRVCPYCRRPRHEDAVCKTVRGTMQTVDHAALQKQFKANENTMPGGLNEWQQMFQAIYPRGVEEDKRSTLGLMEELGELAEAIRVFDRHPKYFAGEAADVFSYIMGIANEHALRLERDGERMFDFEAEFLRRYPGLCVQCGHQVCVCPSVPESTVGRMAKELDLGPTDDLFRREDDFREKGMSTAAQVLERVGGYSGLYQTFPFDRGDANRALVLLCENLAKLVADKDPDLADRLRSGAIRVGSGAMAPGSRKHDLQVQDVVDAVRTAWAELGTQAAPDVANAAGLQGAIARTLTKTRILLVLACPEGQDNLRLLDEQRVVGIAAAANPTSLEVQTLASASVDEFRRKLLSEGFDVIHFSGHADASSLVFQTEDGRSQDVPIEAFAEYVTRQSKVRCVILSACESLADVKKAIAPVTIGMDDAVGDKAAVEFARGFYDALGAGKQIDTAIDEGKAAASLKGLKQDLPLKVLRRKER